MSGKFIGNLPVFLAFIFFILFGPLICLFFFSGLEWFLMACGSILIGVAFGFSYQED